MIGSLDGYIKKTGTNPLLVDVGGVGYAVFVTPTHLNNAKLDDKTFLYVHTHVRDDAIELFGFPKSEELTLFTMLLTVSGIGPRTALLVLGRGVQDIVHAIQNSDVDFFTTIPRLGKKNAQKIIIELKSKLGSTHDIDLTGSMSGQTNQIMDALQSMGFERKEILSIIDRIDHKETIEKQIRHALQLLGTKHE